MLTTAGRIRWRAAQTDEHSPTPPWGPATPRGGPSPTPRGGPVPAGEHPTPGSISPNPTVGHTAGGQPTPARGIEDDP